MVYAEDSYSVGIRSNKKLCKGRMSNGEVKRTDNDADFTQRQKKTRGRLIK